VSYYFKPENTRFICNILIALGYAVLIPWFFSGGPSGHGLWWSPVYSLWVSYFATKKNYFGWLGAYVFIGFGIVIASVYGYCTIAYSIFELVNILFAMIIGTLLIYFYEQIRSYYEELSKAEAFRIIEIQERYLNLLESAPDAILVFNKKQQIVLANLKAEQVFGYTRDELMQITLKQLVHTPQKETENNTKLVRFFAPNNFSNDKQPEYKGIRKDGTEFIAEVNTSQNEKEGTVTATIRDVSERVLMNETLIKQNKQLEHFTQIASHDLRGPVGNLRSLLYLYNDEQSISERAFLISKVDTVVTNLESTLNELLEMTQFNSEVSRKKTRLSFDTVLRKVMQSFEIQLAQVDATISCDFANASEIEYTPVYLESIMQNLLSNALKYRSPLRKPTIHFETTKKGEQTMLRVSDNGIGIDLQKSGHLLFGYQQTFHSNPDAKGIGLFIIKAQVEAMGGEITVSSEVGQGTSFHIVFDKHTMNHVSRKVHSQQLETT
jgi:PAS domain S-box-containing protein